MKFSKTLAIIALLLFVAGNAMPQMQRQSQIEVYAGAALPMAPEEFKDYYKVGLSLHGQYVMFPSPRVGISFGAGYEIFAVDNDAITKDAESMFSDLGLGGDLQLDVEGSANIIELGIGVRPYLSAADAPTQIFAFGMVTYNFIKTKTKINATYTETVQEYDYYTGSYVERTYTGTSEGEEEWDDDKAGVAVGAGIEMPAGESMNLIFQGLYRFIFTEDETTNFLGITAGLIF
ncbi:outer membrane beta-barrel protein [candidate division KSB1 bacterium]|nr:outer membrane beta-barrel protein [candidate division KSB1 bacterium]